MITKVHGNRIIFILQENDEISTIPYTLPDGYSIHKMLVTSSGDFMLYDNAVSPNSIQPNIITTFPIVNSTSPNSFNLKINKKTIGASIVINIFEFGQIPNPNYFNNTFEPILVTTNDENNHAVEYNMIPSTQFER